MNDLQQFRTESNKQKLILLNLKHKSILEEENGFIDLIDDCMSKIITRDMFNIMPIIPFSFFYNNGSKRNMSQSIPNNWINVVKKIDIYNTGSSFSLNEAVDECIGMCNTDVFKVYGNINDSNSSYGIDITNQSLVSFLTRRGKIPMLSFLLSKFEDVDKMNNSLIDISHLISYSDKEVKAIILLNFIDEMFFLTEGALEKVLEGVEKTMRSLKINRNNYKVIVGGELVDYMAVSQKEISLADGFSLNIYHGEEHVACSKIEELAGKAVRHENNEKTKTFN